MWHIHILISMDFQKCVNSVHQNNLVLLLTYSGNCKEYFTLVFTFWQQIRTGVKLMHSFSFCFFLHWEGAYSWKPSCWKTMAWVYYTVNYDGYWWPGFRTTWFTKQKCHFDENFHHWLHWKLSEWQLPVQSVMKISTKWWYFCFSHIIAQCQLSDPDGYG